MWLTYCEISSDLVCSHTRWRHKLVWVTTLGCSEVLDLRIGVSVKTQ